MELPLLAGIERIESFLLTPWKYRSETKIRYDQQKNQMGLGSKSKKARKMLPLFCSKPLIIWHVYFYVVKTNAIITASGNEYLGNFSRVGRKVPGTDTQT